MQVRIPIVNPEPGVDVRVRRSRTLSESEESQDGNQFYIIHSDNGIAAADSDQKEDEILDKLLEEFGVDEILKLRIKFIKVPNDPGLVFDYIDKSEHEKAYETRSTVMENGEIVDALETDARYVRFPETDKSIQLVKVNANILELTKLFELEQKLFELEKKATNKRLDEL